MKYEYAVICLFRDESLERKLNHFGASGWKLVHYKQAESISTVGGVIQQPDVGYHSEPIRSDTVVGTLIFIREVV